MSAAVQIIWRRARDVTYAAHHADWRAHVLPHLQGLAGATVHVTEHAPPRLSLLPLHRTPLALITLPAETPVERFAVLPGIVHAYRVETSVPLVRPAGVRPGVTLLTLLQRRTGLDDARFFGEWFDRHTPMALAIHPMLGYVRNVVHAHLLDGSAAWDGIVTEDYATPADLLSPQRMFGGVWRMLPNMVAVGRHVHSFIELRSIDVSLVTEHAL